MSVGAEWVGLWNLGEWVDVGTGWVWVWELGEWVDLFVCVCTCGWNMGVILHVRSRMWSRWVLVLVSVSVCARVGGCG